jgi:CHAT domain
VIEVKRLRDGADMRSAQARNVSPAKLHYARWNFINEPPHYDFLKNAADKACNPIVVGTPIESQSALTAALASGGGGIIYVYAHGHAAAPSTPAGIAFNNKIRLQIEAIAQDLKVNPLASAPRSAAWTDTYNLLLKTVSNTSVSSLALKNSAEIRLTDLLKQTFRLQDAPIVFLNTCESAQIWNALEGSFAGLFLKRGARAVLGTETTIPIVVADVFGRAVLEQLFAGESLGEAVRWARQALLDNQKNPLGLCYSVYGAADASLFPKPTKPDQGVIS